MKKGQSSAWTPLFLADSLRHVDATITKDPDARHHLILLLLHFAVVGDHVHPWASFLQTMDHLLQR
jgi:hypothetical protein